MDQYSKPVRRLVFNFIWPYIAAFHIQTVAARNRGSTWVTKRKRILHFRRPGFRYFDALQSVLWRQWGSQKHLKDSEIKCYTSKSQALVSAYLSVFSAQVGSSKQAVSSRTPESPRWLYLMSSSSRCSGLDLRAEARLLQPFFVIKQPETLKTHTQLA